MENRRIKESRIPALLWGAVCAICTASTAVLYNHVNGNFNDAYEKFVFYSGIAGTAISFAGTAISLIPGRSQQQ